MIAAETLVPGTSRQIGSIEECRPQLQEIHALWSRLRGDRRMPARRDFDPAEAVRLLPHLLLVDVFADAPRRQRFRIRLQGTAQVQYLGTDWTGHFIHDKVGPAAAERLCAVGDRIVASREPWMSTGDVYYSPAKPFYKFESILLPLSDDDDRVDMVLGLTIFF